MNWFEIFDRTEPVVDLTVKEQIWIQDQLYQLELASKGEQAIDKNMTDLLVLELLIRLIKLLSQSKYSKVEDYSNKISHIRTNEIVRYINNNYSRKISLQLLSETFFISTYHLSRMFKKETGFNIPEYINQVRVLESEKLLVKTKLSILKISENVGYDNSTSFGRAFKKIKGKSPRSYRQQLEIQKK